MFYKIHKNGELNNYDIFKILALLTMVIDHIGIFLLFNAPYVSWFRTIGRLSLPLFAILHGISFKNTSTKSNLIVYGALTSLSMYYTLGIDIFPLNILFNFFISSLVFDEVNKMYNTSPLVGLLFLIITYLAHPIFSFFAEYGTFVLLFMIVGKNFAKIGNNIHDAIFGILTFALYIIVQSSKFSLSLYQIVLFSIGMLIIYLSTFNFRFREYYHLKSNKILLFLSRYSLELYFIHIFIFSICRKMLYFK